MGKTIMTESVYKFIDLVGASTESWEKATRAAIDKATKSVRDLRLAEVVEQDVQIGSGDDMTYRVKLRVSFKMED